MHAHDLTACSAVEQTIIALDLGELYGMGWSVWGGGGGGGGGGVFGRVEHWKGAEHWNRDVHEALGGVEYYWEGCSIYIGMEGRVDWGGGGGGTPLWVQNFHILNHCGTILTHTHLFRTGLFYIQLLVSRTENRKGHTHD